ncbi:tRNA lysidine(34) synthetase TilS [Flavicella sediminum]|uniref:tRNA lysidine(34) synthetase TilS n=1 Tax=Flavicella sediminum TaxID=2585141 RepID=UPI00111EBAC4|nr:tRNA lysidine(34) synthetase TilS [Flavicella sediminum]
MLKSFEKYLQKKLPFLIDSPILIAVSGGIDSVVLTHLMQQINTDCTIAHCNFKLRDEQSNLDEEFVKKLGTQVNFPVITTSFDTQKYAEKNNVSIQMAARELRYDWFEKIRKEHNFNYVLTAHHKDDALETFLINFTRGTGLDGLTGIPEINGSIVRPLLSFSREDVLQYAKLNTIEWREDQSNSSTKYFRNKIRHEIVPILKELNPNLLKSFDKTTQNLSESKLLIDDRIRSLKKHVSYLDEKGNYKISTKKILELKNPKAHLYELLKPYGFTAWKDIVDLLKAQAGKQLFSKTHRLIKDRDELILTHFGGESEVGCLIYKNTSSIEKPIHLSISEEVTFTNSTKETAFIDKSLLKFPLTVRKWQKGDYFYPIGMQGKKKLSKYFKDEKLSILDKENTWLLCNADEIVWVIGKRLDNRYKTTNKTKQLLKIVYKPLK